MDVTKFDQSQLAYLTENGVLKLVDQLVQEIVLTQPANPVEFMARSLQDRLGEEKMEAGGRRGGILSDTPSFTMACGAPQQHTAGQKSQDVLMRLEQIMIKVPLFQSLEPDERVAIYSHIFPEEREQGSTIIKQGDRGDNFYILNEGVCDVFKQFDKDEEPRLVMTYRDGDYFGELALIYDEPRAASVVARTRVGLWCLKRSAYRASLMKVTTDKRAAYDKFLRSVEIFSTLDPYERMSIADALKELRFHDGDLIVKQGERGESFYLIIEGEVRVTQHVDGEEGQVGLLHSREYFGEWALLDDSPRRATCTAVGNVKLVGMDRSVFERLLGPCKKILRRNIDLYEKYNPSQQKKRAKKGD